MTTRDRSPRGPGIRDTAGLRLLAQSLWNLRLLGLFLVGPVLGVVLVGAIFGLAPDLWWSAGIVFLFTLSLFGLLVRAECRRLCVEAAR